MRSCMLTLLLCGLTVSDLAASTWYVDDDNTVGPWHGTMRYPFQNIQDGIDAAAS